MKQLRILLFLLPLTTVSINSQLNFNFVLANKVDAIVAPIIGLLSGARANAFKVAEIK